VAHRTFFSFHYERDVWRSSIVRNSSQLNPDDRTWIEASIWEDVKPQGEAAIQRLIDNALKNTTVTAVLIGAETSSRRWVKYEIDASLARKNGLFGIYIHNIKDNAGNIDSKGINPLPPGYPAYDWVLNSGYANLGEWVDKAYDAAR
jgi:hypothetical protein